MKVKLNNKGFSLIELLVASVLLALVATPMMRTFVNAAKSASRSRVMGEATLASQNVAEVMKSNNMALVLQDPQIGKYFDSNGKDLYERSATGEYVRTMYQSGQETYHLGLTGLKSGSSVFNAMVTLKAAPFNAVNSQLMSDYSPMDGQFSQAYDESENPDAKALKAFNAYTYGYDLDESRPPKLEKREIILNLSREPDSNRLNAIVTYEYIWKFWYKDWQNGSTYQTREGTYYDVSEGNIEGYKDSDGYIPSTYNVFGQGHILSAFGKLPNIYLMYYPLGLGDVGDPKEIIRINNNAYDENGRIDKTRKPLPVKIFLVKMQDPAKTGKVDNNYAVDVIQTLPDYYPNWADVAAQIYSNAKESLYNPGVECLRVNYWIKNGTTDEYPGFVGDGEKVGTLVSSSQKNRMYEMSIEIYDGSNTNFSGEPLYKFTSAKLQ